MLVIPKQAVAVAKPQIVNRKFSLFVGSPLLKASTQPASDIYEDEGILMVDCSLHQPEITTRGYELVFPYHRPDTCRPDCRKYIAEQVQTKKVAVMYDKQQVRRSIATAVRDVPGKKRH